MDRKETENVTLNEPQPITTKRAKGNFGRLKGICIYAIINAHSLNLLWAGLAALTTPRNYEVPIRGSNLSSYRF